MIWSVLAGTLILAGLDATFQPGAQVGAVADFITKTVAWFVDPNVPGIPVIGGGHVSTPATSATSTPAPILAAAQLPAAAAAPGGALIPTGTPGVLVPNAGGPPPALF